MKILHISDTHGRHEELTNLPNADIVVHSGDFCFSGAESEVLDFLNWFIALPYKHKIFIAATMTIACGTVILRDFQAIAISCDIHL